MIHLARLAALAAVLLPLTARAQVAAAPAGVYVTPRVGLYVPVHDDMDGFNTGFGFEVAGGKRFTPNLAAELAIGWFGSGTDTMVMSDPAVGTISGKADFSAIPITATGRLIAPLGSVDLFAVGGFGLVVTELGATAHTSYGSGSQSHGDTSLALVLGMGGSVALTPRMSLDVLGRYLVGSASVGDGSARYDGLLVTGGLAFNF